MYFAQHSFGKIIALAFCLVLQLTLMGPANADGSNEYGLFCNTCSVQADFVNYAINNTPKKIGVAVTHVANLNTNKLYVITMEWERENQVWYNSITDVRTASQSEVSSFVAAKVLFGSDPVFVQAPTNGGSELFGSFAQSELSAINTRIVGTSNVASAIMSAVYWQAFVGHFAHLPTIVFVFANGDTAQYQVDNPGQAGLCCSYIEGSAKDKDGNPLDAPATNPTGVGVSHGGESGPGMNDYQYSTHNWRYVCSFLVNGNDEVVAFLGCVRKP